MINWKKPWESKTFWSVVMLMVGVLMLAFDFHVEVPTPEGPMDLGELLAGLGLAGSIWGLRTSGRPVTTMTGKKRKLD